MLIFEYENEAIQVMEQGFSEQEVDLKIWYKRTMGGTRRTWKHANCATKHLLSLMFVSSSEYYTFTAFIRVAFGKVIRWTDSEDQIREVRFVANPVVIGRPRREIRLVDLEIEEI